jgi:hypothetical protein
MSCKSEYHSFVRRQFSASILLGSLIAAVFVICGDSHAQINGAPPSVTSPGFGGRPINGVAPSVTSLGPRGYTGGYGPAYPYPYANRTPHPNRRSPEHRRSRRVDGYIPPAIYAIPVPYAVDNGVIDDQDPDYDPNYQGGPTVFDRRGSGADSYVPPVKNISPAHSSEAPAEDAAADPEPAQVSTVLVFKDGHQLEVGNYAIVGSTLFDLTVGHARKIAIADLNLDATRQQNDNRGVDFQVPPSLQSN